MKSSIQSLSNNVIFIVLAIYLITRFTNLTLLPIFNDESIYLHWGWIEVDKIPNNLYYSLYDGKQPLLMWVFGVFQKFINDPLMAGRTVSVLTGLLTFLGLYEIGKRFLNKQIGICAAFLYTIIPIFVFFDRQALMESSIACVGVWTCYWFLRNTQNPRLVNIFWLGLLIGIGLFIKSSSVIFFITLILLAFYTIYKSNITKFKRKYLFTIIGSIVVSLVILYPLFRQPDFSKIIEMNNRFSYTILELLQLPWIKWFFNFLSVFEIAFWHITPLLFAVCICGIYLILKKRKNKMALYIVAWFLINIFLFIIFTKHPSPRYIVAMLPLTTIFCSTMLLYLVKYRFGRVLFPVSLVIPVFFVLLLLFSPKDYFYTLQKVTTYVDMGYVNGWTSGYGVIDAVHYISDQADGRDIRVSVKSDSGNPEDAVFVYLRSIKKSNDYGIYNCNINRYEPINEPAVKNSSDMPITYFVSRDARLDGNERCLKEIKKFYKPDGTSFVGVYKIIK